MSRPSMGNEERASRLPERRTRPARWAVVVVAVIAVAAAIVIPIALSRAGDPAPAVAGAGGTSTQLETSELSSGTGGTTPSANPSAPESSGPGSGPLLPRGDFQPVDEQQAGECDGVPAVPAEELTLLNPAAQLVAGVVCRVDEQYVPGDGIWTARQTVAIPADRLAGLRDVLTAPDIPIDPAAICTAILIEVPDFVLTVADGTRVRPAVPGDGCHAAQPAVDALEQTTGEPGRTGELLARVVPDAVVTLGCWPDSARPVDPASVVPFAPGGPAASSAPAPEIAPSTVSATAEEQPARVSLCRYGSEATAATETAPLTGIGTIPAAEADEFLAATLTSASGCALESDSPPAAGGWLALVETPQPPLSAASLSEAVPVATVELGGCRRIVGPDGEVLGFAAEPSVAALLLKADQPAS